MSEATPWYGWQWPVLDGDRLPPAASPLDGIDEATVAQVRRVSVRDAEAIDGIEVLWEADATPVLHAFACWCAERVAQGPLAAAQRTALAAAVDAKRAWLGGALDDAGLEDRHGEALEAAQRLGLATVGFSAALLAARVIWPDPLGSASAAVDEIEHLVYAAERARAPDAGEDAWLAAVDDEREVLAAQLEAMLLALAPG